MTRLYCGIDLRSNNCVVSVLDEQDQVVYERRTCNSLDTIGSKLAPYEGAIEGIVVASTYTTGTGW